MTIQKVIYDRLQATSGLTALVSTRTYFGNKAPQNPGDPYVIFFRIDEQRDSAMGADIGIVRGRWQFSVFAKDTAGASGADRAAAVAEQVRLALQRWRSEATSPAVLEVFVLGKQDLYEDDVKLHHAALDFEIIHRE